MPPLLLFRKVDSMDFRPLCPDWFRCTEGKVWRRCSPISQHRLLWALKLSENSASGTPNTPKGNTSKSWACSTAQSSMGAEWPIGACTGILRTCFIKYNHYWGLSYYMLSKEEVILKNHHFQLFTILHYQLSFWGYLCHCTCMVRTQHNTVPLNIFSPTPVISCWKLKMAQSCMYTIEINKQMRDFSAKSG